MNLGTNLLHVLSTEVLARGLKARLAPQLEWEQR